VLIVDAGAVVRLLLQLPGTAHIWAAFDAHAHDLHAPELMDVEVLSVLRKLVLRQELSGDRADAAVNDLRDLRLLRHAHTGLLDRAWALRENVTPYDGLYVALTETLGQDAALLTTDARLARAVTAARHTTARVIVVAT
jgi:predicted nucleic acid-binding protein